MTTTVRAKLQEIISVKDFGAVGNGTTNDSAAFNAALNAVIAAGGGTLDIPFGTYKVNLDWSSQVIAQSYGYITINGNNSILVGVTGAPAVLKIDRGGTGDNYLSARMEFHNLEFRTEINVCSGGTPVIPYAVTISRSSADFYTCSFEGGSRSAFYGYNYQYGKFIDCTFSCSSLAPTTYKSAGCWIQSKYSETVADQITFDRCVFQSNQNGLYVEGCQQLRVLNSRVQDTRSGGEGGIVVKDYLDSVGSEAILLQSVHFEVNQVRDVYLPTQTSRTLIQQCLFSNPIGWVGTFVATVEQVANNMTYVSNDFRTASGPTLTMSGNSALLTYVGNDKDPNSLSTPGSNPQAIIQNVGATTLDFQFATLKMSAFWGKIGLTLGAYSLWVDSSGRLRIKSGAPSSDTDGTVVGTQT